jgi:hypothetical protein
MGAWGTSIFSDDNAADLREDYRDLTGNGLSGSEATDRLIEEWQPDGNDGYFVATFWLALALTQWKCGRLEERVKARALAAILDGSAIEPWRERKTEKKRRAVLDKVLAQLQSPQPALTKIKRRIPCTCDWEPTELIAYTLLSGDHMIVRVTNLHSDKGGTYPSCEVLDWQGRDIPDHAALMALELRPASRDVYFDLFKLADPATPVGPDWSRICILGLREPSPNGRFRRLSVKSGAPYEPLLGRCRTSGRVVLLKDLDRDLAVWFGFN